MADSSLAERIKVLADSVWEESKRDTTIIRDAGIMQDIASRIDDALSAEGFEAPDRFRGERYVDSAS